MSGRELLIAICLIVAVAAVSALIRLGEWTRAHWALLAFLAAGLVVLALVLWHRRMMVYHRQQWALADGWERLSGFARQDVWACPYCRALVGGLDQAEAHMDPERSSCAAFLAHQEAAESGKREANYTAVLNTPGQAVSWFDPDVKEE